MLEAYNNLVKLLKEQRDAEIKPEQKIEEKKSKEAVEVADVISTEGVGKNIGNLKTEIGQMLVQISDRMESEINRYLQVKKAVEIKDKELGEIYEIQKSASSLMALLEAQNQKRQQFEAEIAEEKEEIEREIETTREEWGKEQEAHDAAIKERDAAEKKKRERETEEYKYQFEREQQLNKEQFEYEKAKLEREMQLKREEMEKDLFEREKVLKEREKELETLRQEIESFPAELKTSVDKSVKEVTERLKSDAQNKVELMQKEFNGEKNVMQSRIEALQQTVKEQNEQIAKLSAQLENSYGQVQDIAVKAIEGSSNLKALSSMQIASTEHQRRSSKDEG